jgi:hypothetical protein
MITHLINGREEAYTCTYFNAVDCPAEEPLHFAKLLGVGLGEVDNQNLTTLLTSTEGAPSSYQP